MGFASGIERLVLNVKEQGVAVADDPRPVVVAHLGEQALRRAMALVLALHREGLTALLAPGSRSLRAQMRYASSHDAPYVVILGEDELEKGVATLREMETGTQRQVPLQELVPLLRS